MKVIICGTIQGIGPCNMGGYQSGLNIVCPENKANNPYFNRPVFIPLSDDSLSKFKFGQVVTITVEVRDG